MSCVAWSRVRTVDSISFGTYGMGLTAKIPRRAAGYALFERITELEKKSERYCLIGHSHGGSVILSALTFSTYRRRFLSGLSRWVTIGTPFIAFARRPVLFFRLGVKARIAYITVITFIRFWLF
jgi:hypothetical protein